MRYLKKFNENNEYQNEVESMIDTMLEIIDDFKRVFFDSANGNMSFSDYIKKNEKYLNFKPVYKSGNKIRSKFDIRFYSIDGYETLNLLISEMDTVIGRLGDLGWIFKDMKLGSGSVSLSGKGIAFSELTYSFFKPDVVVSDDLPKVEEIEKVFNNNTQLVADIGDIYVYDKYVDIGFDSKTYDGDIPEDIDSGFQKVADILGFTEFERDSNHKWGVRFWYN